MIKSIAVFSLILIPMEAFAGHFGGHGSASFWFLGALAMAASAIAGYWVLKHVAADKDAKHARWAGNIVGWTLVVVGVLGFVCAAVSHSTRAAYRYGKKGCAYHSRGGGGSVHSYHHSRRNNVVIVEEDE